jgi:hypothetical protein
MTKVSEDEIRYGRCYSNGAYGAKWAVYQVIAENADGSITFKVVAGANRRRTATLPRGDFARWAQYEVVLRENEWVRLEQS